MGTAGNRQRDGRDGGDALIAMPPRRVRNATESTIVAEIRRRAGHLEWCVCWRNNCGMLRDINGTPLTYGLAPGSPDLIGIVRMHIVAGDTFIRPGRFFGIEVKRPGERPREAQDKFLALIRKMGGAACWCNNADDALAFLERARDPRCDR